MLILSNGGGKVLEEASTESFRDLERFRNANGTRLTADLRIEMQKAMQTDVAIFRNEDSLCNRFGAAEKRRRRIQK